MCLAITAALKRADLEARFSAAVMARHIEAAYFDALGIKQP